MKTQTQTDASLRYCEQLKNKSARDYALAFRTWLTDSTDPFSPPIPYDVDIETSREIRDNLKCLLD